MKKNNFITTIILSLIIIAVGFSSCKKETSEPEPFVNYSIVIDGAKVTFTNESKGAVNYMWDFGDGNTSTDENPVHTYPGKGKYVPTLYATTSNGTKAEASTVIRIAKTSPVKLNDNTLSDWDTISHNVVLGGAKAGNFIKAKYDYDGNNIYIYFEQTSTQAAADIYDVYIDADNKITTGYLSGGMPNGAYDVLLEGTIFADWLDPFYFTGATQADFTFSVQSISEFYKMGTVVQDGATLKFEWAISRSKLKGLTGTGIKISVQVTKNDWSRTVGFSPDEGGDAYFLDMSE